MGGRKLHIGARLLCYSDVHVPAGALKRAGIKATSLASPQRQMDGPEAFLTRRR